MPSNGRPDTYYGYKEVKARLVNDCPEISELVKLLEQEYKHREIKTCAKPAYVLSRIIDMNISALKTEEKNEKWRLKNSIGSFTGTVKSVVMKKKSK